MRCSDCRWPGAGGTLAGAGGMQPGAGGRRLPLCADGALPGCSGAGQCKPGGGPEGALHTLSAGPVTCVER